jgi:N4-(beta-N-acetylglucosaminyl)-L-asparaginase
MKTRREFLKLSALGAAAIPVTFNSNGLEEHKAKKPIVISTWDFGLAANAKHGRCYQKEGRASRCGRKQVYVFLKAIQRNFRGTWRVARP